MEQDGGTGVPLQHLSEPPPFFLLGAVYGATYAQKNGVNGGAARGESRGEKGGGIIEQKEGKDATYGTGSFEVVSCGG